MALKVQLNGTSKKIFKPSKPLTTFVNGTKKKLMYGYTFVNGVKQRLWGFADIKMEIIDLNPPTADSSGSQNSLFYIDDKIVLFNTIYNENGTTYADRQHYIKMYNITNIGTPSFMNSLTWGKVSTFSSIDSNGNNLIFYSALPTEHVGSHFTTYTSVFNKILLDTSTSNITVNDSFSTSGAIMPTGLNKVVKFSNSWFSAYINNNSLNFYENNTSKYSSAINATSNQAKSIYSAFDGSSVLFIGNDVNYNICKAESSSSSTYINNVGFLPNYLFSDTDNKIVVSGARGWAIYDGTTLLAGDITQDYYIYTILGRVSDYYYIIGAPGNSSSTVQDAVLLIIDRSDGTVVKTEPLPPQFNSITYSNVKVLPFDGSSRGYLGCYIPNNGVLRIEAA